MLPREVSEALGLFTLEHALDAVLWCRADGRLVYANAAAARTLGQTAEALAARTLFDLAPELNAELWRELGRELQARHAFSFEFVLQTPERPAVQVDITAQRARAGDEDYICLMFRDVEERKKLKALEQEFVSTVSHELRTPLTVLRESVSQVLEGLRGDLNDNQRRALHLALGSIDRLGRIINELLDLSKIESGKATLRYERVDLVALAREVAAGFQSQADERGLALNVTTPAGPVALLADRDRLIQVLTNLLNNAFKFTEKGGIELAVSARPDTAECRLTDTGVGLSAEERGRLFTRFEQLGRVSVTGEKGSGLGLSICKAIVELHGGRIRAESDGPGSGSRFFVELPRRSARDVFLELVTPVLQEIAQRGGSFSIVEFTITPIGRDALNEAAVLGALEGLEHVVRQHSGRRSDILVKGEAVIYAALPGTVKREAIRVADRIVAAFEGAAGRDGMVSRVRMRYGITGFPDDETRPETFLTQALGRDAL